jgi:hypothetical protein
MKYILTITIAMFLFSCSGGSKMNAESSCEPEWYSDYSNVGFFGKLLGKKSYLSDKGTLYGRGFERAYDRNTAKRMATANARVSILDELDQGFVADLMKESVEEANLSGKKYTEGLERSLGESFKASVEAECRMCFVIDFQDCYNNGKWDAFAIVKLDIENWKSESFQELLQSTMKELGIDDDEVPAFNAP